MRRLITLLLLAIVALSINARPAGAVINTAHWSYGTIYVKNVTPTAAWTPELDNRVLYYHNLGANWNVIEGDCHIGYPCIRLSIGPYGSTGWLGLTQWPYLCGTNEFCNYNGNMNDQTRMAMVMINTSYYQDTYERRAVGCHELGHALANLQHEDGATCMNAAYLAGQTPEYLGSVDRQEVITRFSTISRAPCSGCQPKPATGVRPRSDHARIGH